MGYLYYCVRIFQVNNPRSQYHDMNTLDIARKCRMDKMQKFLAQSQATEESMSALHKLARIGDIKEVKKVISKHPDLLQVTTSDSSTVMKWAIVSGNVDLVKLLEKEDATLDKIADGETAVGVAVAMRNPTMVKYVVSKMKSTINKASKQILPLMAAMQVGIHPSIYLSVYLYLSVCLSIIYLSIYLLSIYLSCCRMMTGRASRPWSQRALSCTHGWWWFWRARVTSPPGRWWSRGWISTARTPVPARPHSIQPWRERTQRSWNTCSRTSNVKSRLKTWGTGKLCWFYSLYSYLCNAVQVVIYRGITDINVLSIYIYIYHCALCFMFVCATSGTCCSQPSHPETLMFSNW